MSSEGQAKIYQMVTERIMDALKNGTVPWVKPWTAGGVMFPRSMSTRKHYRGVNIWLLALTQMDKGYSSGWWGTYKQIAERGGTVRKGEKSTTIVFWKRIVKDDDTAPDGKRQFFMLRYYRVFNACQADGLPDHFYPEPDESRPVECNEDADAAITAYLANGGPELRKVAGDRAYYRPSTDTITLPMDDQFPTVDGRYYTTFHELAHSTGHKDRLNRDLEYAHKGSGRYAKEELVADMASAMVSALFGYESTADQSADYVKGWLSALSDDHTLVISASAQAQRAADLILGTTFEDGTE